MKPNPVATDPTTSPAPGGRGGGAPIELLTRRDANLMAEGLRRQWEFPEQAFKLVPMAMLQLIAARTADGKAYLESPKTRVAAARVLALLHAQNQKADPVPQTHIHAIGGEIIHSVEDRRAAFLARLDRPGPGE